LSLKKKSSRRPQEFALYLPQEAAHRLMNKLRAYALQDGRQDTVKPMKRWLRADARDYDFPRKF